MGGAYHHRHSTILRGTPGSRFARVAVALAGVLTLAALLVLSACGPAAGDQPGLAKDQTFTWPYVWDTDSIGGPGAKTHSEVFDPAVVQWAQDTATINMIYAPLVGFNSQLQVVPDAATWEVDSTGTVYTFHLKQNLKFSDGTPLTAADYAYSIDRALNPNICPSSGTGGLDSQTYVPNGRCSFLGPNYLYMIQGVDPADGNGGHSLVGQGDDPHHGLDVVDPYTLKIRLKSPAVYFVEALTYPTSYPVERNLVDKYPGGLWVDHLDEGGCSGPFMVKSYGDGKELTLVPNPYWAAAYGKKVTVTVNRPLVRNVDDEYANYKAGQYDYTDIPGDKYANARNQDGFNEVPLLETVYFGLNFQQPPFDNVEVRQAFDLALNKQIMVDQILHGGALPTNHIVPRGMPGYNPDLVGPDGTQSLTGNQAKAAQLLQTAQNDCKQNPENDWCPYITGDSKKEIDIWFPPGNQTRQDLTKAAVQMVNQALGLNMQYKQAPSGDAFAAAYTPGGPYQAWIVGWLADYPDPQDFLSLQFGPNSGSNDVPSMHNADFDQKVTQADAEQDPTQRMKLYNAAEKIAVDQCPWVPIMQPKQAWFQRPWVHGFSLNPELTMVDSDWPNVYILAH